MWKVCFLYFLDSQTTSPELVVLTGFLEIASDHPGIFTFSDFISTTRSLNTLLPKICVSEMSGTDDNTFENLNERFSPAQNYSLQLQNAASQFVLSWCEHTCAKTFGTRPENLWAHLKNGDRYSSEDNVVDSIVWETAISHAHVQYDLHNSIALSPISEALLGRTLRTCCVACVSLNQYSDLLKSWLGTLIIDAADLDDSELSKAILHVLATLAIRFPFSLPEMTKMLKDIIMYAPRPYDEFQISLASLAAKELLNVLQQCSKDELVSTLYNFINVLHGSNSSDSGFELSVRQDSIVNDTASVETPNSAGEKTAWNALDATSVLATQSQDPQLSTLALSMLIQKAYRAPETTKRKIVAELAVIVLDCTEKDILRVSNFLTALEESSSGTDLTVAVQCARNEISLHLVGSSSAAYYVYIESLLKAGISRASRSQRSKRMTTLLVPLGILLRGRVLDASTISSDLLQLFHTFWFHLVICGYTVNSKEASEDLIPLKEVARGSPSLALETLTDSFESDLESYPVLKQAHSHDHTKALQTTIDGFVPGGTKRSLPFPKAVYVNAVALLENLKAQAGIADGSLPYFKHSSLSQSEASAIISAVAQQNTRYFLQAVAKGTGVVKLDEQLHRLLISCCDQNVPVRQQACKIVDQIVEAIPSAFCSSLAITTLLESISLLGLACYEEFSDKYSPSYEFKSSRLDLHIFVSDNFSERQENLLLAQRHARRWLSKAMLDSASVIRALLTSYVSESQEYTAGFPNDKGKVLALEFAVKTSYRDQPVDNVDIRDASNVFLGDLTLRHLEATAVFKAPIDTQRNSSSMSHDMSSNQILERSLQRKFIPFADLREKLCSYVARILQNEHDSRRVLRHLVEIPFNIFTVAAMRLATALWSRIVLDRPELQAELLAEVARCWGRSSKTRRGLFSPAFNHDNPFQRVMEYAPTDKEAIAKEGKAARLSLDPHLHVIQFLSSRLASPQTINIECKTILLRVLRLTMKKMQANKVSSHVYARELCLRVAIMSLKLKFILGHLRFGCVDEKYSGLVYDAALCLFANSPRWAFGSDVGQMRTDRQLITSFMDLMQKDLMFISSSSHSKVKLLLLLFEMERSRIDLWLSPVSLKSQGPSIDTKSVLGFLKVAWKSNPSVAIFLVQRFSSSSVQRAVRDLILARPWEVIAEPHAAEYILGSSLSVETSAFRYLLYWAPVVPIIAATLFLPSFKSHPLVLQYAMRSLESHPVDVTFFYVPQIVQALRYDSLGYVRRFIIETAKLSQLFAHQIIWNFDANAFKDENATIPDSIKPTLDSIKAVMMTNLSGADKLFYETEFRFFGEVTSISGKLKPFIKKTKPEKKAKIDEEMALIKVEKGVYLPSNPDGQVIDIERKSGRPLQSHAKAPFMATFKIQKSRQVEAAFEDDLQVPDTKDCQSRQQQLDVFEKKQSAIFKVGDDCRQDVLALQLISAFRSIFNSIGLDLFVFPYRVIATAPGCGVIDVLPNSISRDMLGREAVNGLYDYFITTFGGPETVAFQQARMNFVKSLAAYSVITYLLQFKDRHNGNIMYDSEGHVLHIDFGFCFDIAPGGITFESAPFKLTTEMIAVMGGSTETQSYKMFQELSIKAFLVARQYSEQLIHLVTLMLDSGLPCFKGQTTINNLRNRFHLDVSEHQASSVMLDLIAQSHQNQRTVAYDVFQKMVSQDTMYFVAIAHTL